jgi:hypothetical protein
MSLIKRVIAIFLSKRKLSISGASVGLISIDISKNNVEEIVILNSPIAACKGERLTPPLEVKILDENHNVLSNRKVVIEIYGDDGLLSTKKISGLLTRISNKEGIATFDDIMIKATGKYEISIQCEKKQCDTKEVDIFPPGLGIDYWNYKVGTEEYEERMDRMLMFNTKGR